MVKELKSLGLNIELQSVEEDKNISIEDEKKIEHQDSI